MFTMLAPIAAQKAQNTPWTAVLDILFTPKLSTSINARGAKIAAIARKVGCMTVRPLAVIAGW